MDLESISSEVVQEITQRMVLPAGIITAAYFNLRTHQISDNKGLGAAADSAEAGESASWDPSSEAVVEIPRLSNGARIDLVKKFVEDLPVEADRQDIMVLLHTYKREVKDFRCSDFARMIGSSEIREKFLQFLDAEITKLSLEWLKTL